MMIRAVGLPMQTRVGPDKSVVGRGTGAVTATAQIGDAMTGAAGPRVRRAVTVL
jgi:hypothetical protein